MIELSDYHQGFVVGWFPGFFMGIGLMIMAWDHSERQRCKRRRGQPRELLFFGQPVRLDEGSVQRGNGKGGPTTPKPAIIPKPQFPSPPVIPGDNP